MSDTTNENGSANENVEVLPDWAREQLSKANAQAAKYRTEKKEAVEKAINETTQSFEERVKELEAQLEEKDGEISSGRTEVEKLKAAIGAGVANDKVLAFADLLKGDSPEELASHAEELKELFGSEPEKPKKETATDPSQGSGGSTSVPLNGDHLLQSVLNVINK